MAAPVPAGFLSELSFTLEGSPDLSVPAQVAALAPDPRVIINRAAPAIRIATPCFEWEDGPALVAGGPVSSLVPLSALDLMAFAVARPSKWVKESENALILSVRPSWFLAAMKVLTSVGALDLSVPFKTIGPLLAELSRAAGECQDNPALALLETHCFLGQSRGNSGHAAGAAVRYVWNFAAEMVIWDNDCSALGLLKWAVRPYLVRDGRDQAGSNLFRMMDALRRITGTRSDSLKEVVDGPTAESADEVADALASTWMLLARGASWIDFPLRVSRRTLELDLAARLIMGSSNARSAAFREIFPRLLRGAPLVELMVMVSDSPWSDGAMLSNWEQLASVVMPDMSWDSIASFEAVVGEIACMQALIEGLALLSPVNRLTALRKHLKLVKSFDKTSKDDPSSDAGSAHDEGFSGTAGLMAVRKPSFLKAREEVRQLLLVPDVSFMLVLEKLLQSGDKVFYMVAVRKFSKASGFEEISGCSRFLPHFGKFWAMSVCSAPDGSIPSKIQGRSFAEKDVEALLSGEWHKVDWVKASQECDLWSENIPVDERAFIMDAGTLADVDRLISATLDLLSVEELPVPGVNPKVFSFRALMNRLLQQAKRCRPFAVGSDLRMDQERNWVGAFTVMMKEAGERWVGQFLKPVDLAAPLLSDFLSSSSFLLNSLDRLTQMGDHMAEYTGVLPSLLPQSQIRPVECTALITGVGEVSGDVNWLLSKSSSASGPRIKLPKQIQKPNPLESEGEL
jgi:hypothetical protein